jgi:hypothetical protein
MGSYFKVALRARELKAAFDAIDNLHRRPAVYQRIQQQQRLEAHPSERWNLLLANDAGTVSETLTEAFGGSEVAATVTGVVDGEASVVVMAPGIDAVPGRMPTLTPAGEVSITKITQSARNCYYMLLVCGYVLVTVREALAVAPGLWAVRVAVARRPAGAARPGCNGDCLLAALFTRERLHDVRWQSAADAIRIVQDVSADLRIRLSADHQMLPLDLTRDPALAALLPAINRQPPLPPRRNHWSLRSLQPQSQHSRHRPAAPR